MIIDCPNCNAKFMINPSAIHGDGRVLKCGKCQHSWFFKNPNAPEPSVSARIEVVEPVHKVASARPVPRKAVKKTLWQRITVMHVAAACVILLLGFLGISFVAFKPALVSKMPSLESIYAAIGYSNTDGIKLQNVKVDKQGEGREAIYVVTADIVNVSEVEKKLPFISVYAYGADGKVLKQWPPETDESVVLKPGDSLPYGRKVAAALGEVSKIKIELGSNVELSLRN